MRIEDAIDLSLREPFGLEDVHQALESDLTGGGINDLNDARAVHAHSAKKTRSCSAIDASHRRSDG